QGRGSVPGADRRARSSPLTGEGGFSRPLSLVHDRAADRSPWRAGQLTSRKRNGFARSQCTCPCLPQQGIQRQIMIALSHRRGASLNGEKYGQVSESGQQEVFICMKHTFEMEFGGRRLVLETGHVAEQANAAVLVRYEDTVVLVTATMQGPREGIDFFPLLVDYEERMYAVGKIPGGGFRREGRPTESAILAARMVDRTLRPLFPEGFRNDVQVVATVMSVDQDNPPDIAAM